ncbi:uncharacterized protein G2W53_010214 [Senna tora]|uniref:Uncharacterized protein n=1 Tax=Senna tora TaxID=362788 RepID=A0A834WYW5_9FABA|nr:uncharacterized protein G2W53_010214 [Senna tora]
MGGGRLSSYKKNQSRKKKIDGLSRRMSSRISKGSFDKVPVTLDVPDCSSIANPAIHVGERYNNLCYKCAIVSMAQGSVGRGRLSSSKKKHSRERRTDGLKRRLSSRISKGSFDKKPIKLGVLDCSSFANPAFLEVIEDVWFDLVAKLNCIHVCSSIANPAFLRSIEEI